MKFLDPKNWKLYLSNSGRIEKPSDSFIVGHVNDVLGRLTRAQAQLDDVRSKIL